MIVAHGAMIECTTLRKLLRMESIGIRWNKWPIRTTIKIFFQRCLRCATCGKSLDSTNLNEHEEEIYCKACYGKSFGPKGFGYGISASALQMTWGLFVWRTSQHGVRRVFKSCFIYITKHKITHTHFLYSVAFFTGRKFSLLVSIFSLLTFFNCQTRTALDWGITYKPLTTTGHVAKLSSSQ